MTGSYRLLPLRFARKNESVFLTNEVGDFTYLEKDIFEEFISHKLDKGEEYYNLKSKFFLYDQPLPAILDILATRYRTRCRFLYENTALHMFVVTLRCNQRCSYCHAASEGLSTPGQFDMNQDTAIKSVEFAFQSPSPNVKIEFQGGEPLLNFDIVKLIIEHAEQINADHKKHIEYVICTNLVALTEEHLRFFKENKFSISTSLDGTREIHNCCRKLHNGSGSYDLIVENIKKAQSFLGKDSVSALLTVTPYNLKSLRAAIDEYISFGFPYIFIRELNPFGFAYESNDLYYSNDEFIGAYHDALNYIIELNKNGLFFSEAYATILLSRILTPFSTGFVDLQSPTGAGISGLVYDINGDVFISDEARMLYRTKGDKRFCIGTVEQTRNEVFSNPDYVKIIENSIIDTYPGCAWCVYKPYCGSDPVRNFSTQNDIIGHRPTNDFCKKQYALFDILFSCLEQNKDNQDVFWSWITGRSFEEVRSFSIDRSAGN